MPSYNKSPFAFDDIKEILERASASPKGLSVVCKSHRHAMNTRTRINDYRVRDRKANANTYPPEHPLHNNSIWDRLTCRIPRKGDPNDNTIFVLKRTLEDYVITDLAAEWAPTDVGLDDDEPKPNH